MDQRPGDNARVRDDQVPGRLVRLHEAPHALFRYSLCDGISEDEAFELGISPEGLFLGNLFSSQVPSGLDRLAIFGES